MGEGFATYQGIVDKVRAVRKSSSDEVLYLEATMHIALPEEEYIGVYGGNVTFDPILIVPVDSGINPGDAAVISVTFQSPFGQRFQPALEASTNGEEDDDVLDVMVEDSLIADAKLDDENEAAAEAEASEGF